MLSRVENGRLIIPLEGRIDSVSSDRVDQEIHQILSQHPGVPLTLDADQLTYISSSGLRILMRLLKGGYPDLEIRNASPDIFEIFSVTGMDTMIHISKQMRRVSVEGCPVIGSGAFGTVYRLDGDTVVKVFREGEASLPVIRRETDRARRAFVSGVPTAIPFDIVRVGDQYGAVFEMIDAQNCNDLVAQDPAVLDSLIPRYAAFLRSLHEIEVPADALPAARDIHLKYLSAVSDCLNADAADRLRALLRAMPDNRHLVHGDVHLKNLMSSSGEMILLDMDSMSVGDPVFEFAALYRTYILFNEDDPEDSVFFFGFDDAVAARIYRETVRAYFGSPAPDVLAAMEKKILLLASLRFLATLILDQPEEAGTPLRALRLRHAADRIDALTREVDSLSLAE